MEKRITRLHLDGTLDVLDRRRVLANLVGDNSQQVQGIGMGRLDRENLPVDLLGDLQAAGLVVLDGEVQGLGEGGHFVDCPYYPALCKSPIVTWF